MMCGLMVKAELVPMNSVWPSGSERATASAPIMVPAPGRLSISTGWPSSAWNLGLSRRGLEWMGGRERVGGDHGARAGAVVDQHRLAQLGLELGAEQAGHVVDGAAGRVGHDDLDRPARIV